MTDILKEYPAPWKVIEMTVGTSIESANGKTVIIVGESFSTPNILEFIAETVNNSVRPQITEVLCECSCGWEGAIYMWSHEADNNSSSLCPHCANTVKVV